MIQFYFVKLLLFCASIFLLGCITYCIFVNSLSNGFAFDDHLAIVNNKDTNPLTSHLEVWRHDIWGKGLREFDSHRSFRPLLVLAFRQLRAMYGLEPAPLRVVSILCHLLSTILVYVLSSELLGSILLGFGTSLMFVSHPVHVESVVAVVNLAEPLGCLFYCTGFLVYWFCSQGVSARVRLRWTSWNVFMMGAVTSLSAAVWTCCMVFSVLTKETGVTVSGVVVGVATASLLECIGRRIRCSNKKGSGLFRLLSEVPSLCLDLRWLGEWLSAHLVWIIISLLSVGGYTVFRMVTASYDVITLLDSVAAMPSRDRSLSAGYQWLSQLLTTHHGGMGADLYLGKSDLIRRAENPFAFLKGQERALSLLYLHFRYFWVLLWPSQLSAEYAFDCISKVSTLDDPRNVFAGLMYGGLFVAIIIGIICALFPRPSPTNERGGSSEDSADAAGGGDGRPQGAVPPGVSLRPTALLSSLVWLVVPFVPASGVFLRLGTLLAERLLYVPSVGYCMLLSIVIFKVSSLLSCALGDDDAARSAPTPVPPPASAPPSTSSGSRSRHSRDKSSVKEQRPSGDRDGGGMSQPLSRREWSCRLIYLSIVGVIVFFYSMKTVSRNRAWKDDATLFLDSLDVCPRSAKLHLQVAKLRLNENNPKEARRLVQRAQTIDPEFCDIEYQDALLKIIYENDLEGGLQAAAKNLRCIYTNLQSLELLQKVWSQQMSASPNNPFLVENIGELLLSGGLFMPGGKKLQEAVVMAFEQKKYALALRASLKAENMIPDMMHELSKLDDDAQEAMRELRCYILYLAGSIRGFLLGEADSGSFRLSKSDRVEVARAPALLHTVMEPNCTLVLSSGPLPYSAMALNSLSQLYRLDHHTNRVNADKPSGPMDVLAETNIAQMYSTATAMFSGYVELIQNRTDGRHRHYLSELSRNMKESRKSAVRWWDQAGQSNFAASKFSEAVVCFENAMRYGVKGDVDRSGVVVKGASCPCSVKYWYAHSLAGEEGFARNATALDKAVQALLFVANSCAKDASAPKEMRDLAAQQSIKLQTTLDSLMSDPRTASVSVDALNQ